MGAQLGNDVVDTEIGDLAFKPRNQWHTFGTRTTHPAGILEIISPGGFEHYFEEMADLTASPDFDPARMGETLPPATDWRWTPRACRGSASSTDSITRCSTRARPDEGPRPAALRRVRSLRGDSALAPAAPAKTLGSLAPANTPAGEGCTGCHGFQTRSAADSPFCDCAGREMQDHLLEVAQHDRISGPSSALGFPPHPDPRPVQAGRPQPQEQIPAHSAPRFATDIRVNRGDLLGLATFGDMVFAYEVAAPKDVTSSPDRTVSRSGRQWARAPPAGCSRRGTAGANVAASSTSAGADPSGARGGGGAWSLGCRLPGEGGGVDDGRVNDPTPGRRNDLSQATRHRGPRGTRSHCRRGRPSHAALYGKAQSTPKAHQLRAATQTGRPPAPQTVTDPTIPPLARECARSGSLRRNSRGHADRRLDTATTMTIARTMQTTQTSGRRREITSPARRPSRSR